MVRWVELKEERQPSVAHRIKSGRGECPKIGEGVSASLPPCSFSSAVHLNALSGIHLNAVSGDTPALLSMISLEGIPWPKEDLKHDACGQYFSSSTYCIHRGG